MAKRKKKSHCNACPKPVLYPQNTQVFDLFFSSFSQWRWDMHGNRFIDYQAVKVVAEFMSITLSTELFDRFRTMEQAYLTVIEEKQDGS